MNVMDFFSHSPLLGVPESLDPPSLPAIQTTSELCTCEHVATIPACPVHKQLLDSPELLQCLEGPRSLDCPNHPAHTALMPYYYHLIATFTVLAQC